MSLVASSLSRPLSNLRLSDGRIISLYRVRAGAAGTPGGRNVRRHLLTIAIFLLAGAVFNVGVAWGCALCIKYKDVPVYVYSPSKMAYLVFQAFGSQLVVRVGLVPSRVFEGLSAGHTELPPWIRTDHNDPQFTFYAEARGWPCRCLYWRQTRDSWSAGQKILAGIDLGGTSPTLPSLSHRCAEVS